VKYIIMESMISKNSALFCLICERLPVLLGSLFLFFNAENGRKK
jgi:hypothetical protein